MANWQQQIRDSAADTADLLEQLELHPGALPQAAQGSDTGFALKAPAAWLRRIQKGDPADPLLRQILPSTEENEHREGFSKDPVGDLAAATGGGIIRKYRRRALLVVTGACAMHCRYCFRRHFPYRDNQLASMDTAIAALQADRRIEEVILSGGDPLVLPNRKLFELCRRLEAIGHLRRLRIHTRTPVAVPGRIDRQFIKWSQQRPKPYTMVLHINHPREMDAQLGARIKRLGHWTLLNQAVLLKGVNDDARTLVDLSLRCFDAGILPYYLHLLDPVAGAAHFEVCEDTARRLMRTVSAELPGYLVPKLVRETAGGAAKRIIAY